MTTSRRVVAGVAAAALLVAPTAALGKASHAGWPTIDGKHLSNPGSHSGTLTGLPDKHNELLGGHGDDVIRGGNAGDVLWGDRYPSGQPSTQKDTIYGGTSKDFIYGSHGRNVIHTGGGHDVVRIHYGRGTVYCDSKTVQVYVSHKARKKYKLKGCKRISYKTDRQLKGGG